MQKNENFFDNKTIIAVVLVGVVFFGWQTYLQKKYPNMGEKKTEQAIDLAAGKKPEEATQNSAGEKALSPGSESQQVSAVPISSQPASPEQLIHFENEQVSFDVTSHGLGVKNLVLKKNKDREQNPIKLGNLKSPFGLYSAFLSGSSVPIDFKTKIVSNGVFEGVATFGNSKISRTLSYDSATGGLKNEISVQQPNSDFKGITLNLNDSLAPAESSSFLMPTPNNQEVFVESEGKLVRDHINIEKDDLKINSKSVSLAGISSQYFTTSFLDQSEVFPEVSVVSKKADAAVDMAINYLPASKAEEYKFKFITYAGPKDFKVLNLIDPKMTMIIDFGFFASIAKVLLETLKWFHGFLGNWGVAIILLTLLVRLLVMPFNIASYKSMKKMQKIQPLIQSLRDRHKEDPQTLNREMMTLMKEQKVNPLGGCLPMLLQMPVFFALYQVLGQSIELYQAPFFGWIHDLSLKDPFYILPVLMGASMFLQQKMTPSTMDPTQAKIMQWMPVLFSFMMISLPSGLTLYIFISTGFGIIQQQLFMRDRSTARNVSEVKA